MPLPLYLLAVAVFAMGTSEFVLAGLLPDLADDLGRSPAAVGLATPAFALGMVVGAPLTAALARRWPPRASLLGFVLVFAAAHVVGALVTDLPLLLATRVVAALANAGFLAVALTTAAALVPPERHGRALAVLLAGTTLATVVGVPAGALIGTLLGWRATFWALALLCLPAAAGVLVGVPARSGAAPASPPLRDELAALARPRLAHALLLAALVNAATFAGFTFLAPVVLGPAGLGELWVPVVLVLFGTGAFVGVTAAGRRVDGGAGGGGRAGGMRSEVGLLLAIPVGWAALALAAPWPALMLALVPIQGAVSFGAGTTLIARALREADAAPTMAGGYATGALNVGAVLGPLVASATLGSGALAPLWVSVGWGMAALAALAALAVAGRRGLRGSGER